MANTKVTGDLIASSTIATGNIADNAVTSDKISGITTAHIAEGSNLYYTDARADARVALIVDSAPATLDTLNELAAALGDDPNFATTTANSIGLKAPLASPSFTGNATFAGNISGVRGFFNSGATNVVATFTSTDGTATLQCADPTGNVEFGASGNNFVVQPAGGVAQLTVGASSSTFAKAVNIAGTLTLDQGSLLNGIINTPASLRINIDSNNNNTGEAFIVGHNQTNIDNNNVLFKVEESGNATFAGNVGIGHTTPQFGLTMAQGSGDANRIGWEDGSNSKRASILCSSSTDALQFHTGTSDTERMRITGDGTIKMTDENGGVPTLQVRNFSTAATGAFNNGYAMEFRGATTTGAGNGMMLLHMNEADDARPTLNVSSSNGIFATFTNGKVGIGTGSPDEKLDVENGNIRLKSNSDGNTGILRVYDAGGTEAGQIYPAGGDLKIYSPNDVLLTQVGNVGIGTTSPISKLDIAGNVSQHHSVSTTHNGGWRSIQNLGVTGWLDQTYSAGRLKVFGYENGSVNVSYCEYYVIRHNGGFALNQIGTRLDVGNTHGQVEVQISGSFLQVRNVAQSSLGVARVVFSGMKD